jgi:hypothetical protein
MANVKIYIEGWIEYEVDDAQALLDANEATQILGPASSIGTKNESDHRTAGRLPSWM